MKIKLLYILTLLISGGFLTSCEKEYPEVQYTSTFPVNGEWWVKYEVETTPGVFEDIYHVGYTPLLTFNTSANRGDSIWVSDQGNFWNYKVKSALNLTERTFSVANKKSAAMDGGEPYDITVTISNGKVLPGQGRSTSGLQTDSIHFEIEFEDDPGTIYRASGHRRTGFLEDEH